ncbi:MAG: hypothetical protein ACOX7P_07085 [Oscillospiraceae bacterium]
MNIELTNEQLIVLRTVVEEYTDISYSTILDYQKSAAAADDETVKSVYLKYAREEEEKYNEVKALRDYLSDYRPDTEA